MLASGAENTIIREIMEKVVVTGGAGFIGSHLAEELASQDYHVIILDDLSTGRQENIDRLLSHNNVEFIRGSITDLMFLRQVFQDVSYVFHLAALSRVQRSIADPLTTNDINVKGTLNVMLAAKENGVKRVIYSSSSAIYGESSVLPQSETLPPNPVSPYALTKLVGEFYCSIFNQIYNLSTISLRYFNVFGSGQDPLSPYANVIPLFIDRITQELPPIIFGDGEQSRDFVYVDDVVRANILAINKGVDGVYNIGSGISTTINELAKAILANVQKELKPIYEKPRSGDPRHTLADISKASQLGYKPGYNIEEGLKASIPIYLSETNRNRN